MATTSFQRIGIWVIAIFMAVGTVGSFAIIVLANQNQQIDQARLNELTAQYQKSYNEYQLKVDAQERELSDRYFATFNQFKDLATPFDAASVTELKTEDKIIGDGDELTADSSFTAYYMGWLPDGTVFDSSISDDMLKAPISAYPGGVIEGWTQGVAGMKVGGVRVLSIPSNLAYGEAGSGELIPANTPLKFVVMVIAPPETIPQPEISDELSNYYESGNF